MNMRDRLSFLLRSALAFSAVAICLTTSPSAAAQPTDFPNLDEFVEVDSAHFSRPFSYAERWANVYTFFRTPDGISCEIGPSSRCTGRLPGTNQVGCSIVHQPYSADTELAFVLKHEDAPCEQTTDPVLGVGQKITDPLTGISCMVGADRLTACIRNDHGFLLTSSGSGVF